MVQRKKKPMSSLPPEMIRMILDFSLQHIETFSSFYDLCCVSSVWAGLLLLERGRLRGYKDVHWSVLIEKMAEKCDMLFIRCAVNAGYVWDESVCALAALHGHLDVIKYGRKHGCIWDETTCNHAARGGHFDILKWVRENGCPWDGKTYMSAATCGNMEILEWAWENGCPWRSVSSPMTVSEVFARDGNLEMLQWVHERGCPMTEYVAIFALQRCDYDMAKWAIENGCPVEPVCDWAMRKGYGNTVNWIGNGCPSNDPLMKLN